MNEQVFWVCFLTSPIDLYLFMDLIKTEFQKRRSYKWCVAPTLAFVAVIYGMVPVFGNSYWNASSFILLMFLLVEILFQKETVKKIIYVSLFFFITCFAEMVIALSYTAFTGVSMDALTENIYTWIMVLLGAGIIKLIFVKLWERCFGRNKHKADDKVFVLLLLFPIVTMVLIYEFIALSAYMSVIEYRKVCALIGLLYFADVVLFYYMERLMTLMKQQQEYALTTQKNEMQSQYYKRMEEINHEQSLYRHDMKHHLEAIAGLAAEGNVEELRNISGQLCQELHKVERIQYTGNEILNIILWEKKSQAEKLKIKITMKIEPGVDTSFIKDTDLIAMLGNLMDNAIDAVQKCDKDRWIEISMFETDGNFLMFQVVNCYEERPVMKDGAFVTNKKDSRQHGFGLESVRKIAAKYGGILDLETEGNCFKATLGLAVNYKI